MQHELPTIVTCGLFDSTNKVSSGTVSEPRKVKRYELEFYDADSDITVVNGIEYHKKYGSVLFTRPGDIRYSHLPLACKFISFETSDPDFISELDNISTFFYTDDVNKTNTMYEEIFHYFYSENKFDKMVANAKLLLLLHRFKNEPCKNVNIISKCCQFIENHYYEDITMDNIANSCNVSISYLYKLFREELGLTPGEYLLNCRISAAKNLLINSALPLNEIALSCGFNSQSYFSIIFKRSCGVSPNSFRKKASYLL